MAKTPVGEKTEGMDTEGRAKVPPIAGPMIVPIDQTNGITAYARAKVCKRRTWEYCWVGRRLTFMLRLFDQLPDHGLDYTNVSIC